MKLIQTHLDDRVGTLAFGRYDKRNALGADLIAELLGGLEQFERRGARAAVIRSATWERVWSSGFDVDDLPAADVDPLPYSDPLEDLLRAVKSFPAPVIAMVHGSVWGGACDLVMACDIVLCDESAEFAVTPAKLGLPYNTHGYLNLMARAPLGIVKEMFFTAEPISAERALRAGFVNDLVPETELERRTYAMARTIASRSATAVTVAKQAMQELSDAVAVSPATQQRLMDMRRAATTDPEYHEGIQAFLEKREPDFEAVRDRADSSARTMAFWFRTPEPDRQSRRLRPGLDPE